MKEQIHILFVEDSPDDTELLLMEIQQDGFEIKWQRVDDASSMQQALQSQHWDIIISDYSMPGFYGLEALQILRAHDPITPFILVSGAVGEEVAVRLMREGAQDYVLKDNLMRLGSVIERGLSDAEIKRKAIKSAADLKESNERLRIIYNNTNDCMSLLRVGETHLFFESVNEGFLECFKRFSANKFEQELAGVLFPYFLHEILGFDLEKAQQRIEWFQNVVEQQEPFSYIETYESEDQEVYMESQLNPIVEDGKCIHILWVSKNITETVQSERKLKAAYEEVEKLKTQLEYENRYLQEEIKLDNNFEDIVFASQAFRLVLNQVEMVAPVDSSVLITGETGTGKELIARAIHNYSDRKDKALVKINCAALPSELIESELFGHEKGAFTGANQQKPGRFELAHNGSIFLDEIGELPLELQPKLLRVLQEGELQRLGGTRTIKVDIRLIAATNRDLKKAVETGEFREDLYYRLNVFPIHIPPLRERKSDISPLISFFTSKYSQKFKKKIDFIPSGVLDILEEYEWPGNVRELENLVERAMILSKNGHMPFAQLMGKADTWFDESQPQSTSMKEIERLHILKILQDSDWKINGPGGAAEKLELTPSTVRDRMKKHGIRRPQTTG